MKKNLEKDKDLTIDEVSNSISKSPTFKLSIIKSSKLFIKSNNNLFIALMLASLIVYALNKYNVNIEMKQIYEMNSLFGTINLAMFGIVITGYAIFQAFLSRNLTIRLLLKRSKIYSLFEEYNMNFFNTALVFLLLIITFLLISIIENFSIDFALFITSVSIRQALKGVGIFIYILVEFIALLETKSVVFNIYQAFNINALHILTEHKKDIEKQKQNSHNA